TEAGRPSRRAGFECATYASPQPWLTLDADLAFSQARFTDADSAGEHIPGAARAIVSAGAAVGHGQGVFGDLRVRYFGPRPLIENNTVRSDSTHIVNAQVGYRFAKGLRITLDVFNLFNSPASDIDYYYASRLPGEPLEGVPDVHTHPLPPTLPRGGV